MVSDEEIKAIEEKTRKIKELNERGERMRKAEEELALEKKKAFDNTILGRIIKGFTGEK